MPVRTGTQVVIEGYPASANTYVHQAFRAANPDIAIASHIHSVAQLRRAKELQLPAVVLLRAPTDAIVSLVTRFPWLFDFATEVARYERFYRQLTRIADYPVLVGFDEATTGVGRVIERVNAKFGSEFMPFDDADGQLHSRVVQSIESHNEAVFGSDDEGRGAIPSAHRTARARELRKRLTDGTFAAKLDRCQDLYRAAMLLADSQR